MKGKRIGETVWRHIPDENRKSGQPTSPIHGGKILDADGRWNIHGVFGALYTSLTPRGALEEYKKHFDNKFSFALPEPGYGFPDHVLVSIEVDVQPVLDLTKSGTRHRYDVTLDHIESDSPPAVETCKRAGYQALDNGYNGLLVPCSPKMDETNLVIYIDGLPKNIKLEDGPDRIPIDDELLQEYEVI